MKKNGLFSQEISKWYEITKSTITYKIKTQNLLAADVTKKYYLELRDPAFVEKDLFWEEFYNYKKFISEPVFKRLINGEPNGQLEADPLKNKLNGYKILLPKRNWVANATGFQIDFTVNLEKAYIIHIINSLKFLGFTYLNIVYLPTFIFPTGVKEFLFEFKLPHGCRIVQDEQAYVIQSKKPLRLQLKKDNVLAYESFDGAIIIERGNKVATYILSNGSKVIGGGLLVNYLSKFLF